MDQTGYVKVERTTSVGVVTWTAPVKLEEEMRIRR